jgi:GxxExxY protein
MSWNPNNYSKEQINHFSSKVLEAGFKVHSRLGPGLLEGAYESCMEHELGKIGLNVERQIILPVKYDEYLHVDFGYRPDLIVESCIMVELKSVEKISSLHEAQVLTYMKLSGFRLGLLINFNVLRLNDGIKRFVRDF